MPDRAVVPDYQIAWLPGVHVDAFGSYRRAHPGFDQVSGLSNAKKNRFGIDGITFPASINTNTGLIQVHDASTVGGKQVQGKMNNSDEYLRKTLSQKYKDMEGFE